MSLQVVDFYLSTRNIEKISGTIVLGLVCKCFLFPIDTIGATVVWVYSLMRWVNSRSLAPHTILLITSNLDFTEWGEAFPNKLLGASTLDRIRHAAYQLVLDGKSYRTPRGETEAEKSVVAKVPKTAK
jgi:hypothetical protein